MPQLFRQPQRPKRDTLAPEPTATPGGCLNPAKASTPARCAHSQRDHSHPSVHRRHGLDPHEVTFHYRGLRPTDVPPYGLGDPRFALSHPLKQMLRPTVFRQQTRYIAEATQLLSCGYAHYRVQPIQPVDSSKRLTKSAIVDSSHGVSFPSTFQPG